MDDINFDKNMPIGFIDSGLGGISVLRQAVKIMPNEHFIYYGDSQNAPYGTKPQNEIKDLTYAAVDKLLAMGIKGLVVACNTATSAAVRSLREDYKELAIVGIEPAIKPAVENNHGGKILVMATPMTIKQPKYQMLLAKYVDQAIIENVACPGLMEFVESGNTDEKSLDAYFDEYILPYLDASVETIVLGCTHYPLLKKQINSYVCKKLKLSKEDKQISLIDGGLGTSMEIKRRLSVKGLLTDLSCTEPLRSRVVFYNSGNNDKLIDMSYRLLEDNLYED